MGFWERTWKEREEEVRRRFGPTDPPDYVVSFSWKDLRLPGACALVFPPVIDNSNPHGAWHRRNEWLYLTLGLTQPQSKEHLQKEREARKVYSAYGFEPGILTDEKSDWATQALYLFTTHVIQGVELKWGDRLAFGLHRGASGGLDAYTGNPADLGFTQVGNIRAMLFWPYLLKDASFTTSTGSTRPL